MRVRDMVRTAATAGLAVFAVGTSTVVNAAGPAEINPWSRLKGEPPALSLEDTSFAGKRADVTANVHVNGSRNDWIRSGSLTVAEPNITLMISRLTDPKPVVQSVIDSLDLIDEIKMAQRRYRPSYYAMTTRFGELRGVMFDVDADGIRKYCVGFHKPAVDPIFVKGYICAPSLAQAAPQDVACLIDKIRHTNIPRLDTADAVACGAVRLDPDNPPAGQPTAADRL